MKIDFKSRQTKVVFIILCVILIPIIFNQIKNLIMGAYSSFMMMQPKTVEVAKPTAKEIFPEYNDDGLRRVLDDDAHEILNELFETVDIGM